jgi:hypothetical protein
MSLPCHVEAYSGYKANERPISFWLDPDIDNFTGTCNGELSEKTLVEPQGGIEVERPVSA